MPPLVTRVSSKGQVILPKPIRDHRNWQAGTRLVVEDTGDGVLLRAISAFAKTSLEDVAGCLSHTGTPISIEDMDRAVDEEMRRYDSD